MSAPAQGVPRKADNVSVKLTDLQREAAIDLLASGVPIAAVAELVGVDYATAHRILRESGVDQHPNG